MQNALDIRLHITPRAKKSQVIGWQGEELWIRIAATPEKGEANKALLAFLAKWLDIRMNQMELLSGTTSRYKRVRFVNLTEESRYRLLQGKT